MCSPVKHALVDHPGPAYTVAKKMNKSDVWVSKVARGLIDPSDFDKEQLSKILGKPVDELFPDNHPVEAA